MRMQFTARTLVASAAAAAIVVGGTLPSAIAAGSDRDRDRDHRDRAWVEVCQVVQRDHGHDKGKARDRDDDHRDFRGKYKVEDERRTQWVSLSGRYDCERVQVRSGRVRVSVVDEPRNTDLKSRSHFRLYIDRYEKVTFKYEEDDDHGHGGHRIAA